MGKRAYISGAISSIGQMEAAAQFDAAERYLRGRGYSDVVNPTKLIEWHIDSAEPSPKGFMLRLSRVVDNRVQTRYVDDETFWRECMCICLRELLTCDTIYMLSNWRQSRGARIELAISIEMEMQVIHQGIVSFKKNLKNKKRSK